MPQPNKDLYNAVYGKGLFTGSYDDFVNKFSSDAGSKALHDALLQSGNVSGGFEDFKNSYFEEPTRPFADMFGGLMGEGEDFSIQSDAKRLIPLDQPEEYKGTNVDLGIDTDIEQRDSWREPMGEGALGTFGDVLNIASSVASAAPETGAFISSVLESTMDLANVLTPGGLEWNKWMEIQSIEDKSERERAMQEARGQGFFASQAEDLRRVGKRAELMAEWLRDDQAEEDPKSFIDRFQSGDWSGGAYQLTKDAARTIGEIRQATKTAGTKGALYLMTAQAGEQKWEENLNKGLGASLDNVMSTTNQMAWEFLTEKISLGNFNKYFGDVAEEVGEDFAKKGFGAIMKDIGATALQEGGSETINSIMQTLGDDLIVDKYTGKEINMNDYLRGAVESFVLGGVVGGAMGAAGHAQTTLPMKMQNAMIDKMQTEQESMVVQSNVNTINRLSAQIKMEQDKGENADQEKIEKWKADIEKSMTNIGEVTQMAHDRFHGMEQEDFKNVLRAGREVREAKRELTALEKQLKDEEITQEEFDAQSKDLINKVDLATQNESQVINEVTNKVDLVREAEEIHGYMDLANKGKRIELMTEQDWTNFLIAQQVKQDELDAAEDAESQIVIKGLESEVDEQPVTQEEIDAIIDDEYDTGTVEAAPIEDAKAAETPATEDWSSTPLPVGGEAVWSDNYNGLKDAFGILPGAVASPFYGKKTGNKLVVTRDDLTLEFNVDADGRIDFDSKKEFEPEPTKVEDIAKVNEEGKIVSLDGSKNASIKSLGEAIKEYNEEFGGRAAVYGVRPVKNGYVLTVVDRRMKSLVDITIPMIGDGSIKLSYHNQDLSIFTSEISKLNGGKIADIIGESLRSKGIDNGRKRYEERFGKPGDVVIEGVDMGVSSKKGSEITKALLKKVAKLTKEGITAATEDGGITFDRNGNVMTDMKDGNYVSIASANMTTLGIQVGNFSSMESVVEAFIEKYGPLLRYNNTNIGFFQVKPGVISIDFNVHLPNSYQDAAVDFAKKTGQQSIWSVKNGEGGEIKTGETGENPKANPSLKSAQAIIELLKYNNKLELVGDVIDSDVMVARAPSLRGKATNAVKMQENFLKTVKSLFPDMEIEVFESAEEAIAKYNWYKPNWGGVMSSNGWDVHIEGNKQDREQLGKSQLLIVQNSRGMSMSNKTIAHETWHAILHHAFNRNAKLLKAFKEKIEAELIEAGQPDLADYLNRYSSQPYYENRGKATVYEEYIVEFAASMSTAREMAGFGREALVQRYGNVLNEMASFMFGENLPPLEQINADNFLQFVAAINNSMYQGEDITLFSNEHNGMDIPIEDGATTNIDEITNSPRSQELANLNPRFDDTDTDVEVGFEEPFSIGDVEVLFFMADRMATGTYTGLDPASGINIPLQGGIGCPKMKDYFGKIGWFVEGGAIATGLANKLTGMIDRGKRPIGVPVFMTEWAHMSNKTFTDIYKAEMEWLVQSGQKTEAEVVDALNKAIKDNVVGKKDLSNKWGLSKDGKIEDKNKNGAIRSWVIDNTENADVIDLDGKPMERKWVDVTPIEVNSIEEWHSIMQRSFDVRKSFMGAIHGGDVVNKGRNARALGLPDIAKIVEMTTDKRSIGLPNGTAISAIEFTPRKEKDGTYRFTYTADELKVPQHLSYEYGMPGKALGFFKAPISIADAKGMDAEMNKWLDYNFNSGKNTTAQAISNMGRKIVMSAPTYTIHTRQVEEEYQDNNKKKTKIERANEALDAMVAAGDISVETLNTIASYMQKAVDGARTKKMSIQDFMTLVNDMITEVAAQNPDIKLGPEDINAILDRAARVAPTGVKSIAAFDAFLTRKFAQVSKAQQREYAKQLREAAKSKREETKFKDEFIKSLKLRTKRGLLTVAKLNAILTKFNKVKWDDQNSVDAFVDYMSNVIASGTYTQDMRDARILREKLKRASKSKKAQASTRKIAAEFAKLDPLHVTDLMEYLSLGGAIEQALQDSKFVGLDENGDPVVIQKGTVEYGFATQYIEKEQARLEQIKINRLLNKYDYLVANGTINTNMTLGELRAIIAAETADEKAAIAEDKESAARTWLGEALGDQADRVEEAFDTGIDPLTGMTVYATDEQKALINSFFTNPAVFGELSTKDLFKIIEAVDNFFQNGTTDGLKAMRATIEGLQSRLSLEEAGFGTKTLKSFLLGKYLGGKWVARNMAKGFSSIQLLGERIFGGTEAWNKMANLMGLRDFEQGAVAAFKAKKAVEDEYVKKFAKIEGFTRLENIVTRGLIGFMSRSVLGDKAAMDSLFKDRKGLVAQSIEAMEKLGTEEERRQAEILKNFFTTYVEPHDSYQSFADALATEAAKNPELQMNLDAVKFWQEKWVDTWDQVDAVSREVYDTILDKDMSFVPDRYVSFGEESIDWEEPGFFNSGYMPTERSGSLMKVVRPKKLPANKVINFNFDMNMVNAYEAAMVDVHTAEAANKLKEFFKGKEFNQLFEEQKDARVIESRIQEYVKEVKGLNKQKKEDIDPMIQKTISRIGKLNTAVALNSLTMPIKQVAPVMINTMFNAGRFKTIDATTQAWLSNTNYSINMRGVGSSADIASINRALETEAVSVGGKAADMVVDLLDWELKKMIENPDVWVARSSWITYYEQYLRKNNIIKKGERVDYSTHELVKEAGDWAQAQVDRQQNISDTRQAGEMFRKRGTAINIIRKGLFPFASFMMNQKNRVYADWATITNPLASNSAKISAAKSLEGAIFEVLAFNAIGWGIRFGIYKFIVSMLGLGDDEEKELLDQMNSNTKHNTIANVLTDFFSPVPLTNELLLSLGNKVAKMVGAGEPDKDYFYVKEESSKLNMLLGGNLIWTDRFMKAIQNTNEAWTGKYSTEFAGNESVKVLNQGQQEAMKWIAALRYTTLAGMPAELNQGLNVAEKAVKKNSQTEKSWIKENMTEAEKIQAKREERTKRRESAMKRREKLKSGDTGPKIFGE